MSETKEQNVIGISLGSVYSSIAVIDKDGRGTCIANEDGDRQIPSYVAFSEEEEFAGSQAKAQAIRNPSNTITRFKELLGAEYDAKLAQHSKVKIVSKDGKPAYVVQSGGKELTLTVPEITTRLLLQLKHSAVAYTGSAITGAVLALPIDATENYKKELLSAAEAAGLPVLRCVSEPAAAALAFGVGAKASFSNPESDKSVAVVDLGATNLGVSILAVRGGTYTTLASAHDASVGGDAIDELLVKHFASEFKRKTSREALGTPKSVAKLTAAVEITKKTLTLSASSSCHVDALADGVDFTSNINRSRFDMLASKLFSKCVAVVEETASKAGLAPTQIDEIILVGGCGRIPKLQSKLRDAFPTSKLRSDIESDEAVACGCVEEAALLTTLPVEELVISKEDVTVPHLQTTLGLLNADGVLVPLVRRDTPLPAQRTLVFGKGDAKATSVYLAVYEGELPAPALPENEDDGEGEEKKEEVKEAKKELVAEVVLEALPAGKKAQIEVTFAISAAAELTVTARDKESGKSVRAVRK